MPTTPAILADHRWIGAHGIGRFAREVLGRLSNWSPVPLNGSPVRPLEPWRLGLALRRHEHDVFFSPGFMPPMRSSRPFVFTIHDLIHLDVPGEATLSRRLYYRLVIRSAARQAARVLTVSHDAQQRIATWAGLPKERIVVVGNGVSEAFTPHGPKYESERPYLLYVGNHKPHKNIPGLLAAFALACKGSPVDLLFAGAPDQHTLSAVEQRGLASQAHFIGNVDDPQLAALYRGAVALVMPSFVEGFGLPVLEAMACGTAVICSNTTSLPEVAGDAAILADPGDDAALSEAIRQILEDDHVRNRLRDAGLNQARSRTWEQVVQRVSQTLADAASEGC